MGLGAMSLGEWAVGMMIVMWLVAFLVMILDE